MGNEGCGGRAEDGGCGVGVVGVLTLVPFEEDSLVWRLFVNVEGAP